MSLEHLDTLIAFALVMLGLSLLVTIVVQAMNVGMQNRGNLLQWGLVQFLVHTGKTAEKAKAIASNILSDPALSPNGKRLVAHLSFEELLLLLPKHEKTQNPKQLDWYGRLTGCLHKLLNCCQPAPVPPAKDAVDKQSVACYLKVMAWMRKFVNGRQSQTGSNANDTSVPDKVWDTIVDHLKTKKLLKELVPREMDQIKKDFSDTLAKLEQEYTKKIERLGEMFQLFMDRTTQRFIAHSRCIAIIVSFVLCAVLQIDSLRILEQLSTDSDLRTKLVMGAEATLDRAENTMGLTERAKALATLALEAVCNFKPKQDEKTGKTPEDPYAGARKALAEKGIPKDMLLERHGRTWITANVDDVDHRAALQKEFATEFDKFVDGTLAAMRTEAKALIVDLEDSKLVLFELPNSRDAFFEEMKDGRHILGILITILLISLGAPFWYNTLRGLTNLRPFLANKEEAARKQEAKKSEG